MFDGSHRTNRREINLAGRNTSRSSRTSNLHTARQQRLARAAAKNQTNAATLLQRCFRGVRGRRFVSVWVRGEFDEMVIGLTDSHRKYSSSNNSSQQQSLLQKQKEMIGRLASLLAFRLSPALIHFFSTQNNDEFSIHQDLLSLERILQPHYSQDASPLLSSTTIKRLSITILILLRQSYQFNHPRRDDEQCLAQLLNYLMEKQFRLVETTIGTNHNEIWFIHFFLCLRDSYLDAGPDSMEIEGGLDKREEVQKLLLKWCCRIIVQSTSRQTQIDAAAPTSLQQNNLGNVSNNGLTLLASIIFMTGLDPSLIPVWMKDQLSLLISSLDELFICKEGQQHDSEWSSVFVYFLSRGLIDMSTSKVQPNIKIGRNICKTIQCISSSSSSPLNSTDLWQNALSDTVSSREHIILDQVLSYAEISAKSSPRHQYVFTFCVPTIMQYALQQQQELSVFASFAARGEDIMSWTENSSSGDTNNVLLPNANQFGTAAATAFDLEEIESESDDDDEQFQRQVNQLRQQIQNGGRQSRADLQTVPKLDALYQTHMLQTKKVAMDRAQSSTTVSYASEKQRFVLAARIGSGVLIQQLGDVIFSSAPMKNEPMSGILSQCSMISLHNQAKESYTSCLAEIMVGCSGLKAGRNAASPLLAKLAFHETSLNGLWGVAKEKAYLITNSLSTSSSLSGTDVLELTHAYETLSIFCDLFSHWNLAMDDDLFIEKYHNPDISMTSSVCYLARELVGTLNTILNDLYWVRPVLASDISNRQAIVQHDGEVSIRFQRARLLLSGTKLWNCLYERWCRLFRSIKFCEEEEWWFPQLASRGQHDNNAVIQSQVTSIGQDEDDAMEESSLDNSNEEAQATNNNLGLDALATSFRDPKMARVLTCIPQALPFSRRVDLFQNLLESDKAKTQDETAAFRQMMMNWDDGDTYSGREKVTIHRDNLYLDSKSNLMPLGKKLRKKLQVTFINQHGIEEAGIDGGGVQKEFFDDLIKDAFLPLQHKQDEGSEMSNASTPRHLDFFVETSLETLQVNTSLGNGNFLEDYEFLGRVLGKTMYECILVDPQFSLPFLNKILGKQNSLDDLKNLDPEYYKHLKSLRYMSSNDISSLGLTFETTISSAARYGHSTLELIPGGRDIAVTKENVIQYIHLVSHQRMNVAGSRQTSAFLHGFREIIPAPWVRLFSAYEFQKLISGDDSVKGIDVAGMMSVMRYSGGYHPSQPIMHWLWEVVDEMTPRQQRKFLRFMTSCSRQPLLGFNSLVPAPCIQQTRLREDDHGNDVSDDMAVGNIRLPTSSTCMNLLKLPKYSSKQMLQEKLLYAIDSASGFELS